MKSDKHKKLKDRVSVLRYSEINHLNDQEKIQMTKKYKNKTLTQSQWNLLAEKDGISNGLLN
jgi:hypothetical protein